MSANFSAFESDIKLQHRLRTLHGSASAKYVLLLGRWFLTLVIGAITAFIGAVVTWSVMHITNLKFTFLSLIMEEGLGSDEQNQASGTEFDFLNSFNRPDSFNMVNRVLIGLMWIAVINCILAGAASSVVLFVSPEATGSGIAEVKCALNGLILPGVATLRTLLAKVIGMVLSVASGLPIGKEGPMIHTGPTPNYDRF
jgi:chloride channel 7